MSNHFRDKSHSTNDVKIQIIDTIDNYSCKEELIKRLNEREDYFIKTLNTLYPLGLNDKLLGGSCVSQGEMKETNYYGSPIPRRLRSRGIRKRKQRDKFSDNNRLVNLIEEIRSLFENMKFSLFFRRLKTLDFYILQSIYAKTADESSKFTFILSAFILNTGVNKRKEKEETERTRIVFPFRNKIMDKLDLQSVIHDRSVCKLLPEKVKDSHPPKLCFSLNKPISQKICNYSTLLNELDKDVLYTILNNDCACDKHQNFIYVHHKHVITGDINFIENEELKILMNFGTKHRISENISKKQILIDIETALDQHVKRVSKLNCISINKFDDWKLRILKITRDRLYKLFLPKSSKSKINYLMEVIKDLQNHFIIASVDKASSNYSFICKKFYIIILLKELGFDLSSLLPVGNDTYVPTKLNSVDVISRHQNDLILKFNIKCREDNLKLPKLFWLPKLHKSPYKFRFIAGARKCTTKQLSLKVNKGLSVIRDQFKIYCNAIYKNSGVNCFWSIVSTVEFLKRIDNVKIHNLQVFDFSTLYTNLDQEDVKLHIYSLLELIFNDTNRKYLCIGQDKSFLAAKKYGGYNNFTKNKFKEAIAFILDEVFVTFADFTFQQTSGIPMGGNCSPLLADLFLAHCEFQYMQALMRSKKFGLAKILSNTTRYIDDLCIINYSHFNNLILDIYPKSLEASRSGYDNKQVDYLDVKLKIGEHMIETSVYHKIDDFDFPVTLLTFPDNNMPYKLGIRVFAGQVIRYGRICSHIKDFINKTSKTLHILESRGYDKKLLRLETEKALHKHSSLLHKFGLFAARQLFDLCSS